VHANLWEAKSDRLSCTPSMQDSEASSQRAAHSAGDDCEGADDETSEEDEEETISDREMLDNRLQQVDSAHGYRLVDQESEIAADQMVR
jgi:hypothetical protein